MEEINIEAHNIFQILKSTGWLMIMIAQIVISYLAVRKRRGAGGKLMLTGSLLILTQSVISFFYVLLYFHPEPPFTRETEFYLFDLLSFVGSAMFLSGLYLLVIKTKQPASPKQGDGLSLNK